ncbi:hypothetical protein HME9302_02011 [Alteripontixanthobacter maritimus]|uniref:DUF4345 domain-containing protein n=1 Tax=Alteripontixanthobacter maritimus TaxID=2161824 RepID=A0A369QB64_9SPHN|nr:DUF4345 family protein [Alteripontixanthobacter maritimus]RDC60795.1 hypothetical protein HME9302_02011 [Alteripontixanthobacter maritimus]
MILLLRAALFVAGMIMVMQGIGFLVTPETAADSLGAAVGDTRSLAVLRADMTAFFVVAGGAMLWGAWQRSGGALVVSAMLLSIAFLGRMVSAFADGTYEGFWLPMLLEALFVLLSLLGAKMLPVKRSGLQSLGV